MKKPLKIKPLNLHDPKARRKFNRILKQVQAETKPIADKVRESQRITAEDLAIIINAKA